MTDMKYMFRQDDTSNVDGLAHGCMTEDEKNKTAALQSRGGAGVGERQRLGAKCLSEEGA